ncbi:MAG: tetratricopeptide repeat protein [Pegethrix bostrychoides GSE-TBD4-15B]|jgi:tetratricopeptide (TPR) repeat protein|uniref:Tetratricopeptide repeat protein n=1 Tax=Pegethrix bostrychoides GSE-TBD4-15B TaxID=2839662 RepID=A0A951PET2_9CYAN|nr:tetratricopeptide repeat protein [Pegethrix bostrychoides GSE-TBD4-15B]
MKSNLPEDFSLDKQEQKLDVSPQQDSLREEPRLTSSTPHPEEDEWDKFSRKVQQKRESQRDGKEEAFKVRDVKPVAPSSIRLRANWVGEVWKPRSLSLLAIALSVLALSTQLLRVQSNNTSISPQSYSSPENSPTPETAQPDPLSEARDWFEQGNEKLAAKNYQEAIADYDSAIDLDLKDAKIYNNRGWAYYNLKEYSKAIEDYEKAIKLSPVFATAYNNRGLAYYKLGKYEESIADYNTAISMEPDFIAATYADRGNAYFALDENQKAIEDYTKAISLGSDYDEVYSMKAKAERILAPTVEPAKPSIPEPPLPISSENPQRFDSEVPSVPLAKTWKGEWTDSAGVIFDFEMRLDTTANNNVRGSIYWTIKTPANRPELQSKTEFSATEHIQGSYDPDSRSLNVAGYGKDDPNSVIILDKYKIRISADGDTFDGETAASGETWEGRISGRRVL